MRNKLGLSSRIQLARWVARDEKPAQAANDVVAEKYVVVYDLLTMA
jgi:hypothetical protein